ncbi:MAG: hypothetical protein CL569_15510 [Alphaproteobacteria bacterium]|nr:hypothetical protein [Alphaproteobacteria bacterium]|tara:strand:- start:1382 stop:1639 length:258 start_codon:yes stop_codon:yes gene_type:complete
MSASIKSTIIKIVIWSLIIGLALSLAGVTPESLLAGLGDTVQRIFAISVDMVRWAVPYIILGAVVVIPIWAVTFVWRIFRRKDNA